MSFSKLSKELTSAINDYGSDATRDHLGGMSREVWREWVADAEKQGVELTVKTMDCYYAEESENAE